MIEIIKHGLLTSIQDLGRPGYFHLGIPLSGAMDRFAMRVANLLVGNSEDLAGLEAVFMGPQIKFEKDALVAVTGAEISVKIDDEEYPTWTTLKVKSGQVLSFGPLKSGARMYIAISGGIDVPMALGSRSTYLVGALGGVNGKAIAKGDRLPLGKNHGKVKEGTTLSDTLKPISSKQAELRVLPGLYWHRISPPSQKTFFDDEWKVALEIDRMGYRFKGGTKLEFVDREPPFGAGSDPSNIVDSCYSYGSIQVPGGVEPIILHRDAVSGGGYFTLGAVISADMDIIGQLQPNTPTFFKKVDMNEALQARLERVNLLEKVRTHINEQG
ncbi:biotin-dependent carboxyltransferase [Muricauda ruestringensis]|uniref:Biotin-dependent carboxyltransferase n=1 Tax=Flagellimonas aurea TaxID=2915619 RepID=A0ABS3G9E8_9FLAO|nr:biotin-dependent carboxyltransferase family protein [Allomuricauda aurea]MBO0356039.1 biotin-dependent carboxyltransferase [Allomuricauda aurea]